MDHLPAELLYQIFLSAINHGSYTVLSLAATSRRLRSVYSEYESLLAPRITLALTNGYLHDECNASLLLDDFRRTHPGSKRSVEDLGDIIKTNVWEIELNVELCSRFNRHFAQVQRIAEWALKTRPPVKKDPLDALDDRPSPTPEGGDDGQSTPTTTAAPTSRDDVGALEASLPSLRTAFLGLMLRQVRPLTDTTDTFTDTLGNWAVGNCGLDRSVRGRDEHNLINFRGYLFTALTAELRMMGVDIPSVSLLYFYENAPCEVIYRFIVGEEEVRREIVREYMPESYSDRDYTVPMLKMIKKYWRDVRAEPRPKYI